jgi:5-methylcytosine-specific restriction protein A
MPRTSTTWTRDELILALDLYLTSGHKVLEVKRPETIALASLLNRVRAADPATSSKHLRTPGSVKAKLANFRALDPTTSSTGWGNGNKLDLEIWQEFADDPESLARAVGLIRSALK